MESEVTANACSHARSRPAVHAFSERLPPMLVSRLRRGRRRCPAARLIWSITGGTVVTVDATHRVIRTAPSPSTAPTSSPSTRPTRFAPVPRRARRSTRPGRWSCPVSINTHTHAPMVLFRGLADDLALMDWLNKYIFPAEAKTGLAGVRPRRYPSGGARDDRVGDHDVRGHVLLRGGDREGDAGRRPARRARADGDPVSGRRREDARRWRWRGPKRSSTTFKGDPLITPAVAPHAIYTLDGADAEGGARSVARYGVPTLIHLAETRDEVKTAQERLSPSPVAYLDSLGFFGPGVLAAHGVYVIRPRDRIAQGKGVGVSHNPESNMKLASGTAPVTAYLRAGVALGLGTDGAASNNDLDMFEAMRHGVVAAETADERSACRQRPDRDGDGDDRRRPGAWAWTSRSVRSSLASAPT